VVPLKKNQEKNKKLVKERKSRKRKKKKKKKIKIKTNRMTFSADDEHVEDYTNTNKRRKIDLGGDGNGGANGNDSSGANGNDSSGGDMYDDKHKELPMEQGDSKHKQIPMDQEEEKKIIVVPNHRFFFDDVDLAEKLKYKKPIKSKNGKVYLHNFGMENGKIIDFKVQLEQVRVAFKPSIGRGKESHDFNLSFALSLERKGDLESAQRLENKIMTTVKESLPLMFNSTPAEKKFVKEFLENFKLFYLPIIQKGGYTEYTKDESGQKVYIEDENKRHPSYLLGYVALKDPKNIDTVPIVDDLIRSYETGEILSIDDINQNDVISVTLQLGQKHQEAFEKDKKHGSKLYIISILKYEELSKMNKKNIGGTAIPSAADRCLTREEIEYNKKKSLMYN
jgi:hypothetical protein